ncbi:MAG: SDR family oxidoreductase, partial [Syntrophales bacterium LBB04]|nr:SDR family oxidoreductase [Syntrophales bacterium LBB04]
MKHNQKMLITGVSGLLGNNLAQYFEKKCDVIGLYNEHPVLIRGIRTDKCNLSSADSISKIINNFNPAIIIHCASLTNVDICEIYPDRTRLINVDSTKTLVDSITDSDTCFIYISTDSVYDGIKGIFSENDSINPLNIYGKSKLEGELIVQGRRKSLVLRTNLFGWNIQDKKSLAEWILDELTNKQTINGFQDAIFSTIYTMELARIIDMTIQKGLTGVYNCGSSDICSKYEFALKIAERFCLDKSLIRPISLDDFQFKAKRGKNLSLDITKLQK